MWKKAGKRAADLVLSVFGLIVLWPVFLVISALIACKLGRPVFFTQTRPGLHGKPFKMIKFRTMTNEKDACGTLLPDKQRITALGRFLRKSSLDELPELLNVLKGDMSLVGPRPLLMEYLDYYTAEEQKRHLARPGITGLAQVSGRNFLSWDERLKLDVFYVDNMSCLLDAQILYKTFKNVANRKDIAVCPGDVFKPLNVERSHENLHKKNSEKRP